MSNSFYGGRHGYSFNIAKTFTSVEAMTNYFADLNNTDVTFEDYVLISSEHKTNPEHGRLFKRGADINSNRTIEKFSWDSNAQNWVSSNIPAKGAEFVGLVSGPQGDGGRIGLTNVDEINLKAQNYGGYRKGGELSLANNSLVSGKENPRIAYESFSYQDQGESYTDLAFQFPYPVIEFNTVEDSNNSNDFVISPSTVEPFYTVFDLKPPAYLKKKQIKAANILSVNKPTAEDFEDILTGGILIAYEVI